MFRRAPESRLIEVQMAGAPLCRLSRDKLLAQTQPGPPA
jgi:hypothetical protein